ncbi:MAG TPA: 1-deoxy-D-xylulose-5-phosphate synthase [Acidimicrobiales bacterium]|nr:1-deoxy-D-xylulose-5-phosphate synthase [Acidimicrobiales bacterium]
MATTDSPPVGAGLLVLTEPGIGSVVSSTPASSPPEPVSSAPASPPRLAPPLGVVDPQHLRRLGTQELVELAAEIRRLVVSTLSTTGGHLGSNLGVVELTLALHRVFHSPANAIVWDTGHQAYIHKLVTGRAEEFATLRQAGGLSGYPNRAESVHDLVENSHASTGLSYAYGLASARRLAGDPRRVVAVVGDGSLTGGLAFEALNNIGVTRTPVVIVLNDNGRSYAPTVSRLTTAPPMGTPRRGGPAAFFESLGLSYLGPVDGHDFEALDDALSVADATRGPVVVHVHTVKGRGYGPAEHDPEKCLHDVGPFDPATGASRRPASSSYTEAFSRAMVAAGERNPSVVALTAAMGGPTGLLAFQARFPDRYFDVGIAEQHAVTAAAGMAMGGLRPVVAIYSTFLNRAWDQLLFDVALHRAPVVFCIDRAGVTGEDGPSHHGIFDLALLTKVPGLTVFAPSSYLELGVMLEQALELPGPSAIRWPKTEAPTTGGVGHGLSARQLRSAPEGRPDVCLLGVGKMVAACQEAADRLEPRGLGVTVWDVRVAAPVDGSMVADAARHRLVLSAEDGIADGGVGASIAAAVRRASPGRTSEEGDGPLTETMGLPRAFLPHGRAADILADAGLDGAGLAAAVLDTLYPAPARP